MSALIEGVHFLNDFFPQQVQQAGAVFLAQPDFIEDMIVVPELHLEKLFKGFRDLLDFREAAVL